MQQIYRQSDTQFEVYTTVFSPQVCRSRTRTRHVEAEKVLVAVMPYRARWPKELDLNQGDLVQVLLRQDETWWFGRLTDGSEGYFPAACVQPLQLQGGASSRATPTVMRRVSVPVAVTTAGAPCGCTSGRRTPKLLRKNSIQRSLGLDGPSISSAGGSTASPQGPPRLLHCVLAKSRRKSCPHLPHPPLETGSINTGFQPD